MENSSVTFDESSTMFSSSSLTSSVDFTAQHNVVIGMVYTALCVLVGVSNIFNIVVILKTKMLRNLNGYMMISLAVVDFMVGFTMPIPFLIGITIGYVPEKICLMVGILSAAPANISIGLLALMSLDRFIAISRPLHYSQIMTLPRCLAVIILIVLTTPLVYYFPIFGYGTFIVDRTLLCMPLFNSPMVWLINVSVVYGIASVVIAVSYIKIWFIIRRQKKDIQAQIDAVGAAAHNPSMKNRKTVRTLMIIVAGFYVAWTPLCVYYIAVSLSSYAFILPLAIEVTLIFFAILNSFWNVIIYLATNKSFRNTSLSLLQCGLNNVYPDHNGTDFSMTPSAIT